MYRSKWKQALESANITEEDLLKGTRSLLEEFKETEQRYREILKSGKLEDEPEKLASLEEAVEREDAHLCSKIASNQSAKDRVAKMQAGRGKNSSGEVKPVTVASQNAPTQQPAKTVTKATGGTVGTVEPVKKEDDSSIFGWLLGAAGIAAAVIFGIKLKKG